MSWYGLEDKKHVYECNSPVSQFLYYHQCLLQARFTPADCDLYGSIWHGGGLCQCPAKCSLGGCSRQSYEKESGRVGQDSTISCEAMYYKKFDLDERRVTKDMINYLRTPTNVGLFCLHILTTNLATMDNRSLLDVYVVMCVL